MIKTIIALAAGALFSMNASAGYVQFDLTGPVSGKFIQHDTDQSMAYFNLDVTIDGTWAPFRMGLAPQQSEGSTQLTYATTHFRSNGPSNFGIYSDFGGDQETYFNITFSGVSNGKFKYVANYSSSILFSDGYEQFSGQHTGYATVGKIHPNFALSLDETGGYYDNLNTRFVPPYIGPNVSQVPEPGSLALLAVGAFGLLNVRRRRQA
jgi:hypothetical protein